MTSGAAGGRLDRRPTWWLVVYFANTGPLKRKTINGLEWLHKSQEKARKGPAQALGCTR